jgi:hypothetical protein
LRLGRVDADVRIDASIVSRLARVDAAGRVDTGRVDTGCVDTGIGAGAAEHQA